MSGFAPKIPVPLQIRRIIFEHYNDDDTGDTRFNSDDIFKLLKKGGDIDPAWVEDDLGPLIAQLCDSGAARNIAQNLSTIWLKLQERLEGARCGSCGNDVYIAPSEDRVCPGCGSSL